MNVLNIPALTAPDFTAEAQHETTLLRVNLSGNADTRVMEGMQNLFTAVHREANRLSVQEVLVDFRKLEFMNSSCFKSLVTWLSNVQELAPGKRYKIRLLSDPSKHWQKRSLGALKAFADDLVRIEV